MVDVQALMRREMQTINRTFAAHGVSAAAVKATAIRCSFIRYSLEKSPAETVGNVEKMHREIAHALGRLREGAGLSGKVQVMVREYPFSVEVSHPEPTPLSWRVAEMRVRPLVALAGRSYDAQQPQEEYINLERDYHVLIAAMSGGGKSTLQRMALASLLYNTSPELLRVYLVDLKNDDLPPFRHAPHVVRYAGDIDSAAEVIAELHGIKTARVDGATRTPRILLVVDELAELADSKDAIKQLGSILSTGRALGINVWAATQYPTAKTIGSVVSRAFTVRFVGLVDGANAANVAAQRPKTHAEMLSPGDWLRIAGPDVVRCKAYLFDKNDCGQIIRRIVSRWGGAQVASVPTVQQQVQAVERPAPAAPRIPAPLVEVFEEYAADGSLQRGGMTAAVRALNGGTVPTGTTFQRLRATVDTHLLTYFAQRQSGHSAH